MPNRILREGILTSERVNLLDWDAEVFYRRLMSVVDDFGRYTANPKLLRAALYPLQIEKVRDANIAKWLQDCVEAGLVRVYAQSGASADRSGNQSCASGDRSGGDKRVLRQQTAMLPDGVWADRKWFLEMLDFRQQVRAKESKYPHPPEDATHLLRTCISDATHMQSYAHLDGDGDGDGVEDEGVDERERERARDPPPAKRSDRSRTSRLPPDWVLPTSWVDWALTERPDWQAATVHKVAEQFRDYWLAKGSADARKADWQATWRNWVRRERSLSGAANTKTSASAAPVNRQEALEAMNRQITQGWLPPELRQSTPSRHDFQEEANDADG